jgi:hypothetical protein
VSKRRGQSHAPLDADDVLAGRRRPTAAEVLDLIHRANPTGRDVGAREAELRYAQKARLQSLLVRRFQAELEVVPDPAHDGTVSLRHRGHGRDGCHAVVATLDDDARAWVQLQLDLGMHLIVTPAVRPSGRAAPPPPPPAEDATPEALVRRAEQEIAAYDYEGARHHLVLAVEASGGATAPALALLALLVEILGDDAGALEIEASLSPSALADAKVRGSLALAAARSGQEERAFALARGADEAQAAAVLGALAAGALAGGDVGRATILLDEARRRDPTSPATAAIAEELTRTRAAARGPAEAQLAALVAGGRDADAERKADEIHARWPESEAVRRARRTLEERRRRAEEARLAAEAERALTAGDAGVALAFLGQAAVTARGPEREMIERRIREIEAAERARREAERVEHVCRLLSVAEPRDGLLAYLDLDEPARARVRDRCPREELSSLDLVATGRATAGAKVEAVLALQRARALAEREPEAVLALLAPHEGVLERVPEARRVVRDVGARLRAERIERARAEVLAARAELAAFAATEALARLRAADLRDLPEPERAEAAAVEAAAAQIAERRRRTEEVGALRAAGRIFEARALAGSLAATAEGEELRRWEDEREAVQAEIQRAFRVEVDDEPCPPEELGRFRPLAERDAAPWWRTADGRGIVLAWARERWIVVRVLELETRQVRPTVLLRTPEPFGRVDATVCGATLWLVGEHGAILEIAMDRWEVRDFRPSADVAAPTELVETALLVVSEDPEAPRYFWVATRPRGGDGVPERLRIIDLAQRRMVRDIREGWSAKPIAGLADPRVAVFKLESCGLHTPRGAPAPPGRLRLRFGIHGMAAHPSGPGFIASLAEEPSENLGDDTARPLRVGVLSPSGALLHSSQLEDTHADWVSCVATARDAALVFHTAMDDEGTRLFAFEASERALSPLWEVTVSAETTLVQDAGARGIVALVIHDEGVDAAPLGRAPPQLPPRRPQPRVSLPDRLDVLSCGRPSGERNAAALALSASLRGKSQGEILRWVHAHEEKAGATPEDLVEVVFALRAEVIRARFDLADGLAERLWERFPAHPEVRLLCANAHASSSRWAEAGEALVGIDAADLDAARAQHLHHLWARVLLQGGRFDEAAGHVTAAQSLEGRCDLRSLDDLTAPRPSVLQAGAGDAPPLAQLRDAVQAADAHLARGDHAGVIAALDRPVVWAVRELQSLARLVEAHLQLEAGSRVERLRKLVVMGVFVDALDGSSWASRSAPLPGAWDETRLAEVGARARAWLSAHGEPRVAPILL